MVTRSKKGKKSVHNDEYYTMRFMDEQSRFRDQKVWWERKEAKETVVAEREGGATLSTDWFDIFLPKTQLSLMEEDAGRYTGSYKRMQWFLDLMSKDEQLTLEEAASEEAGKKTSYRFYLPAEDQETRGGFFMKTIEPSKTVGAQGQAD